MYKECLHTLRPKIKLYKSFEKAKEEVENLRKQLYPNLNEAGTSDSERKLNTIDENESEGILTEDYNSENIGDSDDDLIKPRSEIEDHDIGYDYEDDFREQSPAEDVKADKDKDVEEKTQEDLEFEAMYEKISLDSIQERIKESTKINPKDIPVPMTARTSKKTYEQLQVSKNYFTKKVCTNFSLKS